MAEIKSGKLDLRRDPLEVGGGGGTTNQVYEVGLFGADVYDMNVPDRFGMFVCEEGQRDEGLPKVDAVWIQGEAGNQVVRALRGELDGSDGEETEACWPDVELVIKGIAEIIQGKAKAQTVTVKSVVPEASVGEALEVGTGEKLFFSTSVYGVSVWVLGQIAEELSGMYNSEIRVGLSE
ncbi:MAG: hypothetical protein V1679_02760 [Candidatus Peregrinibacteria bacterium]